MSDIELQFQEYHFNEMQAITFQSETMAAMVDLLNAGFGDFVCEKDSKYRIQAKADDFFLLSQYILEDISLPGNDNMDIEFKFKIKKNLTNIDKLQRYKEIGIMEFNTVTKELTPVCEPIQVEIPIKVFINGLLSDIEENFNIYLFGKMGAGKSSFINSLTTIFNTDKKSRKQVLRPALALASGESCTRQVKKYSFGAEGHKLNVFDVWGFENQRPEAWTKEMFAFLMRGVLPESFNLEDAVNLTKSSGNIIDNLRTENCEKAHVAIFVLSILDYEDEEWIAKLMEFMMIASEENVRTMVLLTQVDLLDSSLKDDPFIGNPAVTEIINRVNETIGIPIADIIPMVNYVSERETTWYKDRASFVPIRHAILLHQSYKNE